MLCEMVPGMFGECGLECPMDVFFCIGACGILMGTLRAGDVFQCLLATAPMTALQLLQNCRGVRKSQ